MKRGKDEEKIMGPMFPRLHVNDTEKGGPRAPPRNKMALYEQLSIPSQRFNSGVLPLNPNSSNLVPPQSSSQDNAHERVTNFPLHIPPSTLPMEKRLGRFSDFGAPPARIHQKNLDEEDFTVPIFVNTGKSLGSPKKTNSSLNQEHDDCRASNISRLRDGDSSLQQEYRVGLHPNNVAHHGVLDEATRIIERQNSLISRREFRQEEPMGPGNALNQSENREEMSGSLQNAQVDDGDDISEASMVDSLSDLDISPDDVVGIIGQKHFWKARKAIVNQQRVFGLQVFELHRLIKVQRLIAETPNLVHEENAFLGKSLKGSLPKKKLPLGYIVKPPPQNVKHRDVSEKPNEKIEFSAENAMGKTSQSLSSAQNCYQPSYYLPFSGNPPPMPVISDPRIAPWCFPQSPGQQWLIPVMSPSEGLVYKPYPGPAFMGPAARGYGSPGPTPMGGNFVNPAYAVPPPHQYHGMGIPSPGQGYFHPFMNPSMSSSAGEQLNYLSAPAPHCHPSQQFNTQNQTLRTVPSPRNQAVSNVTKLVSIDSEIQGSTASSPSERAQVGDKHHSEGTNALPLFPTSPAVHGSEVESQPTEAARPTRVIRVVPHNARSATESAARRIFQSIQKERKQDHTV